MRVRGIVAVGLLLASTVAEARAPARARRTPQRAAAKVTLQELRAAVASRAWMQGEVWVAADPRAPSPAPGTALRAVLPPEVLAALEAAAAVQDAPASSTDGLSWRDLRPQDASGRRILPLAMGRF